MIGNLTVMRDGRPIAIQTIPLGGGAIFESDGLTFTLTLDGSPPPVAPAERDIDQMSTPDIARYLAARIEADDEEQASE